MTRHPQLSGGSWTVIGASEQVNGLGGPALVHGWVGRLRKVGMGGGVPGGSQLD